MIFSLVFKLNPFDFYYLYLMSDSHEVLCGSSSKI